MYKLTFIVLGLENVAKKLTDKRSWVKISPFIEAGPSKSTKCEISPPGTLYYITLHLSLLCVTVNVFITRVALSKQ